MRTLRIYHPESLALEQTVTLTASASHHLRHVLRITPKTEIILFNGQGGEYSAEITSITKQAVTADIKQHNNIERESPLNIILAQVISRGDKMDYTLQKAVELGVHSIVLLTSTRCGVKLDAQRLEKKLQHWRGVITSACEQCGRNAIPTLEPLQSFSDWVGTCDTQLKLILHPRDSQSLKDLKSPSGPIALTIGPEGGFTDEELQLAQQSDFTTLQLGPRILRTETAGLTAIACLQSQFGDLR